MRILYVTDLHGVEWKYNRILETARSLKINVVLNGGDMLPMKGNLLNQDKFIIDFLDTYFYKFDSLKIYYLTMLGNDDLIKFDEFFQAVCDNYDYIHNIAQKIINVNGYEFIGMNWVTDLPFALKDRARKDDIHFTLPKTYGNPVISSETGWNKINDWASYIENLPNLDEELKLLPRPSNMNKAIYVMHMPPSNVGLDVCQDGRKVGSNAMYSFIKKTQPFLTFHGHIHESCEVSGKWYSEIGKTICIQSGQSHHFQKYLVYALIDTETMNLKRKIELKEA
jgi:Icc-related predicted phosphoesterase